MAGIQNGKTVKMLIFTVFCNETVHPSGEMSNFLLEDYEAVTKFMNGDTLKKKLKL